MNNALIWVIVFVLLAIFASIWIIFKKVKLFIDRTTQVYAETDQARDSLKSDLSTNFKSITERLDQQQLHNESIPRHNSTFYFNATGEVMNLKIGLWKPSKITKSLLRTTRLECLRFSCERTKLFLIGSCWISKTLAKNMLIT